MKTMRAFRIFFSLMVLAAGSAQAEFGREDGVSPPQTHSPFEGPGRESPAVIGFTEMGFGHWGGSSFSWWQTIPRPIVELPRFSGNKLDRMGLLMGQTGAREERNDELLDSVDLVLAFGSCDIELPSDNGQVVSVQTEGSHELKVVVLRAETPYQEFQTENLYHIELLGGEAFCDYSPEEPECDFVEHQTGSPSVNFPGGRIFIQPEEYGKPLAPGAVFSATRVIDGRVQHPSQNFCRKINGAKIYTGWPEIGDSGRMRMVEHLQAKLSYYQEKEYLAIDYESPLLWMVRKQDDAYTDEIRATAIDRFREIIAAVKEVLPEIKVGFWSLPPSLVVHQHAPLTSQRYQEYQARYQFVPDCEVPANREQESVECKLQYLYQELDFLAPYGYLPEKVIEFESFSDFALGHQVGLWTILRIAHEYDKEVLPWFNSREQGGDNLREHIPQTLFEKYVRIFSDFEFKMTEGAQTHYRYVDGVIWWFETGKMIHDFGTTLSGKDADTPDLEQLTHHVLYTKTGLPENTFMERPCTGPVHVNGLTLTCDDRNSIPNLGYPYCELCAGSDDSAAWVIDLLIFNPHEGEYPEDDTQYLDIVKQAFDAPLNAFNGSNPCQQSRRSSSLIWCNPNHLNQSTTKDLEHLSLLVRLIQETRYDQSMIKTLRQNLTKNEQLPRRAIQKTKRSLRLLDRLERITLSNPRKKRRAERLHQKLARLVSQIERVSIRALRG